MIETPREESDNLPTPEPDFTGWRDDGLTSAGIIEFELAEGLVPDAARAEELLARARNHTLTRADRAFLDVRRQMFAEERLARRMGFVVATNS